MQSVVPEVHLLGADLDVPLNQGDRRSGGEPLRRGGLAQFWRRLCTDAARLAREPRSAQESDRHRTRRAALSDVGFLSPELRRGVRGAQLSELADRSCQARHSGGIPPSAAGGSLAASPRPTGRRAVTGPDAISRTVLNCLLKIVC